MPTIKPDDLIVNSLTAFFKDVGNQFQMSCKYLDLDLKYCIKRFKNEGLSFVTKTLPLFGKHFDTCLQTMKYTPSPILKRMRGGALPIVLQGLTCKVFATDGTLLDTPDADAVRLIRQLAYMFYKLAGEYPKELVDDCIESFIDVDKNLTEVDSVGPEKAACIYHASLLIKHIFQDFDPAEITPRPGPGQCSTKVPIWERFEPKILYSQVHSRYPYYHYYYMGRDHLLDSVRRYRALPRLDSGCSRLTTVPKDSRGPRIICMEPPEYMWLQQGLCRKMVAHLERHPFTRGHVNFTDQTINGNLAREGSASGKFATLDMKEASDRISRNLVELLFDEVPELQKALLALSVPEIALPDGSTLQKKKYAPMGSALCFPVMSIVHYVLGVASMMLATGEKPKALAKQIYVYGDDLVVESRHVDTLLETFPIYGLKFNVNKCCFEGLFRESCGIDAFNGIDVTPQRVKTYALSRFDSGAIATHLAMFHGFFSRGLWNLAKLWQDKLIKTCGWFPCVSKTSSAPGWIVPRDQVQLANEGHWKWNHNLQSPELKARVFVARPFAHMIGGWEQVLKSQNYTTVGSSSRLVKRGCLKIKHSRIPLSSV